MDIRRWWPVNTRGQFLVCWALAAIAGLLAYANSFSAALTFDSGQVLTREPQLQTASWHSLRVIFTSDYWYPILPSNLYRPLTSLSYLVNYAVLGNGTHPLGYHVVNLLLHLANAGGVIWLALRLARSSALALISGLLFAVHPVTVEAVTNIVGRADLLAAFFVLLALACHVEGRVGAFIGATLIGLLCKESAVAIVPTVFCIDWLFFRPKLRDGLRRYWPLLPVLALFGVLQVTIGSSSPIPWQFFVDNPIAQTSLGAGLLTAAAVQVRYLGLLVWPARLSADYSYDQIALFGTGNLRSDLLAWSFFVVAAALLWLAWRRRHWPLLILGLLSYVAFMVPTANFLKTIGSIMAERFLYLPLVGFAWAIGALAVGMLARLRSPILAAVLGLAAASALAIRTQVRNRDWQTDLSLWRATAQAAPNSFKAHKGLAAAMKEADASEPGIDAAIAEAEKGLAIIDRPEVQDREDRRENSLLFDLGQYYQAKADFRRSAGDRTGNAEYLGKTIAILQRAAAVDRWIDDESHRRLLRKGQTAEQIRPVHSKDIYHSLAVAQLQAGQPAEAIPSAITAVTFDPFNAAGFEFLAACEIRLRRMDATVFGLYLAIFANPNFSSAWDELGQVYARRSPGSGPIWHGSGDARTLDADNPVVRPDLLAACRAYDRLLSEQGYPEMAEHFHAFALRAFHFTSADLVWPDPSADPLAAFKTP